MEPPKEIKEGVVASEAPWDATVNPKMKAGRGAGKVKKGLILQMALVHLLTPSKPLPGPSCAPCHYFCTPTPLPSAAGNPLLLFETHPPIP